MLETTNLHIDSTGWKEEERNGVIVLVSHAIDFLPKGAVTEYKYGKLAGEQLFSWKAGIYWAKKLGKKLPMIDELEKWISKQKPEDIIFAGYRPTDGSFNYVTDGLYLWSAEVVDADKAHYCSLLSYGSFSRSKDVKQLGFSVRCLADNPLSIEERLKRLEDKVFNS
jgi:hypothetical protein